MKPNKYLFTMGLTGSIIIFIIAMTIEDKQLLKISLLLLFFITPVLLFIPRIITETGILQGIIALIINIFSLPIILFSAILPFISDMIEVLVNPKNEKKFDVSGMLLMNLAFYLYIVLVLGFVYMIKQGFQPTAPKTEIALYLYYSLCALVVLFTVRVTQWIYNAMDKILPLSIKTALKQIDKHNKKNKGVVREKQKDRNNSGPIDFN